jgi:hypothetical protein
MCVVCRYLFVDPKDPTFDVWVMIVGNVIDCENRAVLDGTTAVGPKCRVTLRIVNDNTSKWVPVDMYIDWNYGIGLLLDKTYRTGRRTCENDHGAAIVVVNERPKIAQCVR